MKNERELKDDKFDIWVTNYTTGDKCEGNGKATNNMRYFSGSKYNGKWREGRIIGLGTFYLKNGERYEGKFVDNKYNGYGIYYYNNGDYLEGIFKNDYPRGSCILHKKDGTNVEVLH